MWLFQLHQFKFEYHQIVIIFSILGIRIVNVNDIFIGFISFISNIFQAFQYYLDVIPIKPVHLQGFPIFT